MPLLLPNQAEINKKMYPKAPTWDEIEQFLKEADIKPSAYARIIGMRINTFADVKVGYRKLPAKYWGLIFNKIVPKYGQIIDFKPPKKTIRKKIRKVVYNVNQSTVLTSKLSSLTQS